MTVAPEAAAMLAVAMDERERDIVRRGGKKRGILTTGQAKRPDWLQPVGAFQ